MPRYEDVTPSPETYREILRFVIEHTVNDTDREWAIEELKRVKNATEWTKSAK